jgi:DNA-directed RNA polymerase specialized sigma54-like protein
MNAIMHYQKEFFLDGDETKMKPMILKDIADLVGLDISTISRVANSKFVETPYGTKLIKEFFSEAMTNDQGEEVSTLEIKKNPQRYHQRRRQTQTTSRRSTYGNAQRKRLSNCTKNDCQIPRTA